MNNSEITSKLSITNISMPFILLLLLFEINFKVFTTLEE